MDNINTKLDSLSPEKRRLFEMLLMEKGLLINEDEIIPQTRTGGLPLSYSEQRLWFMEQYEPASPAYVIPAGIRLKGKLNTDLLKRSVDEIISRHEIFRTNYRQSGGNPVRIIRPEMTIDIEILGTHGASEKQRLRQANEFIYKESRCPFNLSEDSLIRVKLIRLKDEESILLILMHHIVSDNWSTAIFLNELISIYNAYFSERPHGLKDIKTQYADYAIWQRNYLSGEVIDKQKSFWKRELEGCSQKLELLPDKSALQGQPQGSLKTFEIPGDLKVKLNQACRQEDATLFMFLMSAFSVLLYKYSNQSDFNIGYPIANRNHTGIGHTIGFFVNTLVHRCRIEKGLSFRDLLQKTKTSMLGAFDNQDMPFEILIEELKLQGETAFTPLFQAMFVLNNAPLNLPALEGLSYELMDIDNGTLKFDIILSMTEEAGSIRGKLEFNQGLFNESTIDMMITHYKCLLENICNDPSLAVDSLSMMDKAELEKIMSWSNEKDSYTVNKGLTLHGLFEKQAKLTPGRTAIKSGEEIITYKALNDRMEILANYLISSGIKTGDTVGVFIRRSVDYITSALAVMKAGGVYVPLDITYPAERLKYITEDAALKIIITTTDLKDILKETGITKISLAEIDNILNGKSLSDNNPENPVNPINPANPVNPDPDPAYIIYTSGSTGRPKGVPVCHRSIADHCIKINSLYGITPEDRILQFASFIFDASLEQIFSGLLTGAALILRGDEVWHTSEFASKIKEDKITVINPPTSYWQQLGSEWSSMAQDEISLPSLRLVISGGDIMTPAALKKWQSVSALRKVKLLNAYGPTETTITSALFEVPEDYSDKNPARIPIGRPAPGRSIYILDKEGRLCPQMIAGEIYIGGQNLAPGYLGKPELTAEKFIPDSFSNFNGARLYRTGDLGRWLATGDIEYLGRADEQIKIRGFRIELGEIESQIKNHPSVKDAIVLLKEENGDKKLAACIISVPDSKPDSAGIRNFLKAALPDYMIPSDYIFIESFPLLKSGKVDKKQLLELKVTESFISQTQYVAPRSSIEKTLADLTARFLNKDKIGVFDNFFELGGHSMLAMQVVSKIREEFQVDLPLKTLFEKPSIAELAIEIVRLQAAQADPEVLRQIMMEFEE